MDPTVEALKRLVAEVGGYKALAQEIGANDQSIYQICTERLLKSGAPKGVGRQLREKITRKYPNWLSQGGDSANSSSQLAVNRRESTVLRLLDESTVPQSVMAWETVMTAEVLPDLFSLEMPDGALEPRIARGTVLDFRAAQEAPPPGSGVLVEDSSGRRYIRRVAQAADGAWQAQALNDAFLTLHSVQDGLVVLGVMTGYRVRTSEV
jgi:hypothetical protein